MPSSKRDLAKWNKRFCEATSRVDSLYLQLPVAEADAVYRERVYCYELYHQLRCDWGNWKYSLTGEVDKNGQPLFRGGDYAQAKPDFLVHVPGSMDDNLVVVEVKSSVSDATGWQEDIEKLAWFTERANYSAGMLLVYGGTRVDDAINALSLGGCSVGPGKSLSIWRQSLAGHAAELVRTLA